MRKKYNAALDLYDDMTRSLSRSRPNCEKILEIQDSWALNKELKISDELENIIASKERENEFTIYSFFKIMTNGNSVAQRNSKTLFSTNM